MLALHLPSPQKHTYWHIGTSGHKYSHTDTHTHAPLQTGSDVAMQTEITAGEVFAVTANGLLQQLKYPHCSLTRNVGKMN